MKQLSGDNHNIIINVEYNMKVEYNMDDNSNKINNNITSSALVPELVLNPDSIDVKQQDISVAGPVNIENSGLTEQEKAMVKEFAQKIDISDSAQILQYGSGAQKKIADFSENALANVRTKDMDEVGKMITDLVVELKDFQLMKNLKVSSDYLKKQKGQ